MARERATASVRIPVILGLLVLPGAFAQSTQSRPAFDAASVREVKNPAGSASIGPLPGGERFQAKVFPLHWLISAAYNVSIRQISGLPSDLARKEYDIEAKTAQPASRSQMLAMLQTLLEDRFKLRFHRQTKELTVYVLQVDKAGPKFKENSDGADLLAGRISASKTAYRNFTMPLFASILAGAVQDIVIDETGLSSSYDFTLEYMPEKVGQGVKEGREPPPDPGAPSIFTALREQLGLKLESRKTAVDFLIIDHVEEPAED